MHFKAHWEAKIRVQEVSKFIAKLQTSGRRCGTYLTDEVMVDLSSKSFDIAEMLQDKQVTVILPTMQRHEPR